MEWGSNFVKTGNTKIDATCGTHQSESNGSE